jgi:hypothetical protein
MKTKGLTSFLALTAVALLAIPSFARKRIGAHGQDAVEHRYLRQIAKERNFR